MAPTTGLSGIFQSDLIIRSAILAGFKDMRVNSWVLDYVFSGMAQDPLTQDIFGEKQIQEAKKWFLKTEIPVYVAANMGTPKLPCITISLIDSTEDAATLADKHYDPQEPFVPTDPQDPTYAGPFVPAGWAPLTGTLTLPPDVAAANTVVPGQFLVDRSGNRFEILDVPVDNQVVIAAGSIADFGAARLQYRDPAQVLDLESVVARETYTIGCHVQGPPINLLTLHSCMAMLLWRYKQALFEARGLERTQFSSTDFAKDQSFEVEVAWSRYINLTGYVRQSWPKAVNSTIQSVRPRIQIIDAGNLPSDMQPVKDALWAGDKDTWP